MQIFAVSANGSVFLLDQKVYLSHFSNAKYADTIRKNKGIYTQKEKKQST